MDGDRRVEVMAKALAMYIEAAHNPDDTLFLSLTKRETALVTLAMIWITNNPIMKILVEDDANELRDKIKDAVETQKGV